MPIKINKNVFICLIQNYIIHVYLSIMSNSFGYLDIILLGMIAGVYNPSIKKYLRRKTHETKVYPTFDEEKFRIPKKDIEPKNKI